MPFFLGDRANIHHHAVELHIKGAERLAVFLFLFIAKHRYMTVPEQQALQLTFELCTCHSPPDDFLIVCAGVVSDMGCRQTAGHRVIVLAGPKENTSLSTNGITVKEDYQLQKLHSKIETALWLKETPELLIIASRSSRTKAMLTAVSKNKIKNCPVISFTRMKDKNFISDILGVPVISAYFEGWLSDKNQIVTAYGRNPEIILCAETGSAAYQTMEKLLADTRIGLRTNSLPLQAFWNSFAVYAPCSLLSAASGKSIFDITKNKELRKQLQTLLKEIVSITPRVLPPFDADELLKRIFNIPSSYNFPLAEQIRLHQTGDIDFISSVIQEASFQNKCTLPLTGLLLKSIYEQIIERK